MAIGQGTLEKMVNKIKLFLAAGESQTVEFKTSFDKSTIESVVAFANTSGGTILIGVGDKGIIHGVTLGKETLNEWLGQIKSATSPSLIPDLMSENIEGKIVVIIHINEFPVKPANTRGRYYKRRASSNHQLSLSEISDLYLQSLNLSWDSYKAPSFSMNDLSLDKINLFIRQVNSSGRFSLSEDPIEALEKLRYLDKGYPTWAAVLLFAKDPVRHNVHIGRFKTASTIIDDRQITDTLPEAVDQAMKFIVSHISVAFEFDGNPKRKERFAYPLPALREALLNAIVHRDYANPSDIQIKIFDDQVTFFSPGRLYGGISIADIQTDNYQSHLRNKLIAEAFYLTNNIEKYGSGFIRIRKELENYPEISFQIKEVGGGVLLTFGINQKTTEKTTEKIINLVKTNPDLTIREIAKELGLSTSAIEKQINTLKNENRLARIGPDKGGYWQVIDLNKK